jgi:hypothetical protein
MRHFCCPLCESERTRYLFDTSNRSGLSGTSAEAIFRWDNGSSGFVAEAKHAGVPPRLVERNPVNSINPERIHQADVHPMN